LATPVLIVDIATDGCGCLKTPVPETMTLAPASAILSILLTETPPST